MPKNAAPCTDHPLSVFFPPTDSHDLNRPNKVETTALSICASCPLARRTACRNDALRYPLDQQYGVVGGTTAAQRKAILQRAAAVRSAALAA